MKVLVLHTTAPESLPAGRLASEFDLTEAAEAIASQLPQAECVGMRGTPREILSILEQRKPDVVFNLCEAPLGRPDREAPIAALFEWQGVRFTGSGSETLSLCRRKDRTKAVLAAHGIPVPRTNVFPCIIKPVDEDGSAGIDHQSICEDERSLRRARARLGRPAIVEEFLTGSEFVIAAWGNAKPTFVSIGEVSYKNGLRLFTYEAKWHLESDDYANSRLEYPRALKPALRKALMDVTRRTWAAVGIRGYMRFDARLDDRGVPYVLDVNPNPDVSPDLAMYRAVNEAGWSWKRFVRQQVEWASAIPIN